MLDFKKEKFTDELQDPSGYMKIKTNR